MNKNSTEGIIYSLNNRMLEPPERYGHILLVQLADITARLGWTVEAHAQYCHEIIFILEGEAVMAYNGQRFNIQAGQMVIVPEAVIHDVRYVSPATRACCWQAYDWMMRLSRGSAAFFQAAFPMKRQSWLPTRKICAFCLTCSSTSISTVMSIRIR